MRSLSAAALVVVLLAGGCSSSGLITSNVAAFGALTTEAVDGQKVKLATFSKAETERIKAKLARDKVELTYSPGCVAVVHTTVAADDCFVMEISGKPVETAYDAVHVIALGEALAEYAAQLGQLAADSSKDGQAFGTSLTGLATSVGQLDAALAGIANTKPVVAQGQLGALATVAAEVGKLYLRQQRASALRKIIIAAHPFVQEATTLLSRADGALRGYDLSMRFNEMVRAQGALGEAIAANSGIGPKQEAFVRSFEGFRQAAASEDVFLRLGAAHGKLADAARAGASVADMAAYLTELTQAAKAIAQATKVLRP